MVAGTVHESMKAEVHLEGEGTCPDLLCVKVQQQLLKRRPIAASDFILIQDSTASPSAS